MWEDLIQSFMDPWYRSELGKAVLAIASFIGGTMVVGAPFVTSLMFQMADPSSHLEGTDAKSTAYQVAQRVVAWIMLIAVAIPLCFAAAALWEASERLPATGVIYRNSLQRSAQGFGVIAFLSTAASIVHRIIWEVIAMREGMRRRAETSADLRSQI